MHRRAPGIGLITALFGIALLHSSMAATAPTRTRLVTSFETPADVAALQGSNARLTVVASGVTEGTHALRVDFAAAAYPSFSLKDLSPRDWSGFSGLAMDVTNPGNESVQFQVRIDETPNIHAADHAAFGSAIVEPGQTVSFVLRATGKDSSPASYGMLALPPTAGLRSIANLGVPIDFSHVCCWQVYLRRPTAAQSLIFDNVRLVALPSLNLDKIVDSFGQYTRAEWPGKIHSLQELESRRVAEEKVLHSNTTLRDRDRFGGWARGPKFPAHQFFSLKQLNGKWWFVDPDGRLFLSFGVNTVSPSVPVFISNREFMFEWLPKRDEPLGKYFSHGKSMASGPVVEGPTYDFLAANLARISGPGFIDSWRQTTLNRLSSWGFNTLGKTCEAALYRSARIPYIPIVQFAGSYQRVSAGRDTWGPMHDPFDPAFREAVAAQLTAAVTASRDDPWCIGYFVDNELSWGSAKSSDPKSRYGLAFGTLKLSADASSAKQAFLTQLKQTYGSISKLNTAWNTQLASWDRLAAPFSPSVPLGTAVEADFSRFLKSFARRYFTIVGDELRRLDPNHLYLGCRFAQFTPEAVEAAAEKCDAFSFNIYQPRIDSQWDFLKKLRKPALIGEFHMGALDRGMFAPGLVEAPNQQARATMVQDYVRSVADHPALIGCHWFRYVDEPLVGHVSNGENYNIGLVSITDTPYPELTAAFRSVFSEVYARRSRAAHR